MKKKKRIFLLSVILCLLVGGVWSWVLYHKGRPSLTAAKTDVTITANQLLQAFVSNEDSANKLYLGKVLEVKGQVASKTSEKQHTAIQISGGNVSAGGINCALRLSPDTGVNRVDQGQIIKIKGRCIGYLMDVNLVDAVIIN